MFDNISQLLFDTVKCLQDANCWKLKSVCAVDNSSERKKTILILFHQMPSHPKLWSSPNDISNSHMARTPDAGTGIIADKDFQPGERVLRIERPFLVVPDSSKLKVTCSQCFVVDIKRLDEDERESIKLKKCGGCGILRFCSPVFHHH